jgi:hypothetical protein
MQPTLAPALRRMCSMVVPETPLTKKFSRAASRIDLRNDSSVNAAVGTVKI